MDLIGRSDFLFELQHRHADGTWSKLEPRPDHHDPASHDPERDWAEGRLYVCATCDEEVLLRSGPGPVEPQ